jgi:hypothetical protein
MTERLILITETPVPDEVVNSTCVLACTPRCTTAVGDGIGWLTIRCSAAGLRTTALDTSMLIVAGRCTM